MLKDIRKCFWYSCKPMACFQITHYGFTRESNSDCTGCNYITQFFENSNIGKIYIPPGLADQFDPVTGELTPGLWRKIDGALPREDFGQLGSSNATFQAKEICKEYTEYFAMEGAVPWQWIRAHIDT